MTLLEHLCGKGYLTAKLELIAAVDDPRIFRTTLNWKYNEYCLK
jgi:hypothetical protein